MKIAGRDWFRIKRAILSTRFYKSIVNSLLLYQNPIKGMARYFFNAGRYPAIFGIKTPIGIKKINLKTKFSMVNVNEVFCREDYYSEPNCKVVVDIGANIGISALYFLTRNTDCICYCFEPNPENIPLFNQNLADFTDRYQVQEKAVAGKSGRFKFSFDYTGVFGGLLKSIGDEVSFDRHQIDQSIVVDCASINDVLSDILSRHDEIDILKIDSEGTEIPTVNAIEVQFLKHINTIYIEAMPTKPLHPDYFESSQYSCITRMKRIRSN